MDKQQIIDYIMHTPSNTNPVMLGQFLDEYSGGSGESWSTFFEGEVTTEEQDGIYSTQLSNSEYIDADKIKITFDGVEYECNKTVIEDNNTYNNTYGGSLNENELDFSNYPFIVMSVNNQQIDDVLNFIVTESPGTYSIKIEVPQESEGSGDWSTAEVTFISSGSNTEVAIPNIVQLSEDAAMVFPTSTLLRSRGTLNNVTTTLQVPLYKGYCHFQYIGGISEVSGNVTKMGNYGALITGDCFIDLGSK